MKILWLIPITVDRTFQFTSKNELARGLREQGHEIETVVAYEAEKIALDGFSAVEYVRTGRGTFQVLRFHWRMLRAAFRTDADAVLFGTQAAHLIPLSRLRGIVGPRPKLALDIRTVPVDLDSGWASRIGVMRYELALWLANQFADGVTVITPMLGETVKGKLKKLAPKIGVWTSGVCLEHFEREGADARAELGLVGKKVLFHHGTLSPNRGLQEAIRALERLKDDVPDLVFLMVGDGTGRPELERQAREAGVADRVIFTGKVPYREIPSYVRSCDVAILPFPDIDWWAVSSPIKLMEYLALGVRIVATDIPAHRWLADQTGGVLLAKNSKVETLAEAISSSLSERPQAVPRNELENIVSWRRQASRLVEFLAAL